ncbi:MAG: hypothetical protein ACLT1A_16665 [Dysosmobacter sp.]
MELDQAHRVIKGKSDQQNQEILLQLADLENELREETSLTSFITGFPLGMGIHRGNRALLIIVAASSGFFFSCGMLCC